MDHREFEEITAKLQKLIDLYQKHIKWTHIEGISDLDITLPQYYALMTICTLKRCSMKELVDRLDVSHPTVTGIVDRLVKHGYVVRHNSVEDRRVVYVELSPLGTGMVKKINEKKYEYLKEALKNLSAEELREGVRAFTIFSESLLSAVKGKP